MIHTYPSPASAHLIHELMNAIRALNSSGSGELIQPLQKFLKGFSTMRTSNPGLGRVLVTLGFVR